MWLTNLYVNNFRNIRELKLELSPVCNLFYGANGSGKTSLLEALYYLSTARSFRSHLPSRVIQYGCDKFVVATTAEKKSTGLRTSAGVERSLHGAIKIQLQGSPAPISELAASLPMQLLHQGSFALLTDGPRCKRKFIDWGMFHVEHNFLTAWNKAKRALEQRNFLLKGRCSRNHKGNDDGGRYSNVGVENITTIAAWNQELAKWGDALHCWRERYLTKLLPIINDLLAQLLGNYRIAIHYYAGWNVRESLLDVLQNSVNRDQTVGFTQFGPHRADLRLLINEIPVQDCLSRGQQKIFIFVLYLAQGLLMQSLTGQSCIYLIDDLAAELDHEHQQKIAAILHTIKAQLFITALEKEKLRYLIAPLVADQVEFTTFFLGENAKNGSKELCA